jgi:hypothetical protein
VFELLFEFTGNGLFSVLAAILYAVHPVHVEAVANVYGRNEVLSTLLLLAAILIFNGGIKERRFEKQILSALLFAGAVLSKESALTGLVLAPLYARLCSGRSWQEIFRALLYWVLAAAACMHLRSAVLGKAFFVEPLSDRYHPENPLIHNSFGERIWPAFYLFGRYLSMLIMPVGLSADYSFTYDGVQQMLYSWSGLVLGAATLIYVLPILLFRKERLAFWGLWLPVSLALTINLLVPIGTFYADRLLFLPSLGFSAVITALILAANRWSRTSGERLR